MPTSMSLIRICATLTLIATICDVATYIFGVQIIQSDFVKAMLNYCYFAISILLTCLLILWFLPTNKIFDYGKLRIRFVVTFNLYVCPHSIFLRTWSKRDYYCLCTSKAKFQREWKQIHFEGALHWYWSTYDVTITYHHCHLQYINWMPSVF